MNKLFQFIRRSFYLSFLIVPNLVQAQNSTNFGLDTTASTAGLKKSGSLSARVGELIGVILGFVGVIFLILIIYAGITIMTANGNKTKVEDARKTITGAVTGLIVVLSAYAITAFMGSSFGK
ncbi:MAG TPA: hypothetical protein PLT32_01845 [bacterium]|nr:hypothetical protein [bacterium]